MLFNFLPEMDSTSARELCQWLSYHLNNSKLLWPYWTHWESDCESEGITLELSNFLLSFGLFLFILIRSNYITMYHIILYRIISYYIIISYHITSHHNHINSYDIKSYHIIIYDRLVYHIILCYLLKHFTILERI